MTFEQILARDIVQVKGKRPHRYYLHRLFAADEHNAKLIELSYRCLEHEEGETLEAKNAAGRAHFKKVLDKLATGQIEDHAYRDSHNERDKRDRTGHL